MQLILSELQILPKSFIEEIQKPQILEKIPKKPIKSILSFNALDCEPILKYLPNSSLELTLKYQEVIYSDVIEGDQIYETYIKINKVQT
jgi:hypothetical protein